MWSRDIRILLVTGQVATSHTFQAALAQHQDAGKRPVQFHIDHASTSRAAMDLLQEMGYDAILNYIDKDFNLTKDAAAYPSSQAYNSILNEPVPMINEIIFTNRISGGTNFPSGSTWTNTLTVFVEVANLNGVKNRRDYDLEIQITSTPSSRDLKLTTGGFVKIDMYGPWLENEYRVLNNQVSLTGTFSIPASMTVRPCTYNITARIKDMSGADPGYPAGTIVDQVTGLALSATDAIQAGAVSQLTAPMDMASTVSKTPRMARSGFLSNWTDAQYVLRTVTAFPAYLANWDPVITPGFYNREGYLSGGDTNGVTTWLMHSRSQDRLDSVGELHRVILDTRQGTSDGSTTYWDMRYNATMTWPPNPPKPIRDYQYFDRFAVTTNVPTRGTVNSNSRYSNVLAQAYVNMAVEQFPGIQGVLSRAKMYCPPNLMTTNRAWTMTPQVTTWDSAQKIALKQILDRDVVLALPYAGVDSTTTDQYMNWGNRVDSTRMKWAQKWGTLCGGQPSGLYWGSEGPYRVGAPFGGQDTDVDWRNQPDYRTPDVRGALGIPVPDLSETLQEEYYQYDGNLVGQWFGVMNPRQNLFTILVAAQSIIPKPAGTPITAADVMSERRAVLVVWRDPWPTAEDSRKYDESVPKADRTHRSFVRFFKWLDE